LSAVQCATTTVLEFTSVMPRKMIVAGLHTKLNVARLDQLGDKLKLILNYTFGIQIYFS